MKIKIVFTNESPAQSAMFPNNFSADSIKVDDGFLHLYRDGRNVAMFNLSEVRYWCEIESEPTINEVRKSLGLNPIENNTKGAEK